MRYQSTNGYITHDCGITAKSDKMRHASLKLLYPYMCGYILSAQTVRDKVEKWDIEVEFTQLVENWYSLPSSTQSSIIRDAWDKWSAKQTLWPNVHTFVLNYTNVVVEHEVGRVAHNAPMVTYMEVWGEMLKSLEYGL